MMRFIHSSTLAPRRFIYSLTGKWQMKFSKSIYSFEDLRKDIEKHWKPKIQAFDILTRFSDENAPSTYILSMFPYPSGKLHMGHVRVYTISDVLARFHRLRGLQVIHPMGWDSFGLPAENAAREKSMDPTLWTTENIARMKEQLNHMLFSFDWNMELSTCDPTYYKWTQYIFLKMFENGLIYRAPGLVNWDPVDKTVLANEQVDEGGFSWRSGAKTEKRYLKQWYIRTTAFAKSLSDELSNIDSMHWKDVIKIQRSWIGKCDGCRVYLKITNKNKQLTGDYLSLFTHVPQLLDGSAFVLVNDTHWLCSTAPSSIDWKDYSLPSDSPSSDTDSDTVKFSLRPLNLHVLSPYSGENIPIFAVKSYPFPLELDSMFGLPEFISYHQFIADDFKLPVKKVLDDSDNIISPAFLSGIPKKEAFRLSLEFLKSSGHGAYQVSSHLRDWLISRQRSWGTPIPLIHCSNCGTVPVPYDNLPVLVNSPPIVSCPKCHKDAKRESDTMDTFVDSSWYFLRYLSNKFTTKPFDSELVNKFCPVDVYVGGKEHAMLHLYFARFFCHFLHSVGLLDFKEPFKHLLTQGMIFGKTYRCAETQKYLDKADVKPTATGDAVRFVTLETGGRVIVDWEKMSKSKYNGVDPDDVIKELGIDATRLAVVSGVAPTNQRNWNMDFDNDVVCRGVFTWQRRVWLMIGDYLRNRMSVFGNKQNFESVPNEKLENEIKKMRNSVIANVTYDFCQTFTFNSAISRLHVLTNFLLKVPSKHSVNSQEFARALSDLVIMMSPFAPMFCSELWAGLQGCQLKESGHLWEKNVLQQNWPTVDFEYPLPLKVTVNGNLVPKTNAKISQKEQSTLSDLEILERVMQFDTVSKRLLNREIETLEIKHFQGMRTMVLIFLTRKKKST